MAVGIRSNASTGSYGATLNQLGSSSFAGTLPDYIGGRQGTIYIDWSAVDRANGYNRDAMGRVLGSSKRGFETADERAQRLADREKVWARFVNNWRGTTNRAQMQNNSASLYRAELRRQIQAGKSVAEAQVAARRYVNDREQNELSRVAANSGLKIYAKTTR